MFAGNSNTYYYSKYCQNTKFEVLSLYRPPTVCKEQLLSTCGIFNCSLWFKQTSLAKPVSCPKNDVPRRSLVQ